MTFALWSQAPEKLFLILEVKKESKLFLVPRILFKHLYMSRLINADYEYLILVNPDRTKLHQIVCKCKNTSE